MRWERLFEDLEAEAEGLDRAVLDADVADRLRTEWSLLRIPDRLRAHLGGALTCHLTSGDPVRGIVREVGVDWVLLDGGPGRDLLVALHGVAGLTGLPAASAPLPPGAGRGLRLPVVLRGLARDRAHVRVQLLGGAEVSGTVDRVGADHLDLALHPDGEPRRRGSVTEVRTLPLAAVVLITES
jgi:hypothetical protein